MSVTPVTLILLASGTLGVIMFLKFLRGERNGGGMIATHLILGAAALEQIAMLFRGAPNGDAWPERTNAEDRGGILGLRDDVWISRRRCCAPAMASKMLYIHVGVGALGGAADPCMGGSRLRQAMA